MTGSDRNSCQTLLPSFALGLTTLAFIIAKTGRDALFFQGSGGLLQLPLIYINIGAASLPLAIGFVKAMKIWGARSARLGVLTFAAAVMALTAPFLEPGDNKLLLAMFMFIPAIFGWSLPACGYWHRIFSRRPKSAKPRTLSAISAPPLSPAA